MKIDLKSTLSLTLVITLIGAAISFGIIYQKVESLALNIIDIKTDVRALYNLVIDKDKMANR